MTTSPRSQFDEQGYAVFKKVLNAEQVKGLRGALKEALGGDWYTMQAFRIPEVAALLEHKRFISSLRALLGNDFVFLPEQTALGPYFGPWHTDVDAHHNAGYRFHEEPDFRMATAVIYLQDNHPTYAGGLSLMVGGTERRIPTKAGDMLVFDTRMQHKATPPSVDEADIPPQQRKYGIYFTVSANNAHAAAYREFTANRGGPYTYMTSHSYPADVQRVAQEQGLTLMP